MTSRQTILHIFWVIASLATIPAAHGHETDPFGKAYPKSPAANDLTPASYLDAVLTSAGTETYIYDAQRAVFLVQRLALPLHDVDYAFAREVLKLAVGPKWQAPSGRRYDLREAALIFPELGTPAQREAHSRVLLYLLDSLYDPNAPTPDAPPGVRERSGRDCPHLFVGPNAVE